MHIVEVNHILWEPVINLAHPKYRPDMQSELKPYIMHMIIQLFVVPVGLLRSSNVNAEG